MKKTIVITLFGLACIAFGVWFYFSPYITVTDMMRAAAADDAATLSTYIDYPAMRESLKSQVNAMIASGAATKSDTSSPGAALLSAMFGQAFVDRLVNLLTAPEIVVALVEGGQRYLGRAAPNTTDTSMRYISFNRFSVALKQKDGLESPIVLILKREGFVRWRLAAVRLPNLAAFATGRPHTAEGGLNRQPQ